VVYELAEGRALHQPYLLILFQYPVLSPPNSCTASINAFRRIIIGANIDFYGHRWNFRPEKRI